MLEHNNRALGVSAHMVLFGDHMYTHKKNRSLVTKDLKGKISPSRLKPSKTKMSMYEMEIYTELKCEKYSILLD